MPESKGTEMDYETWRTFDKWWTDKPIVREFRDLGDGTVIYRELTEGEETEWMVWEGGRG